MFQGMIEGLIGFVVMDGPAVLMVMMGARIVLHHVLQLVNERRRAGSRQATLHGEAIQRQAQQQEEVDDAAQKNHQVNLARL